MNFAEKKIAVVGLGYVGLPLAIEFGKKYKVLGFDIKKSRVRELNEGKDITNEANFEDLISVSKSSGKYLNKGLTFSYNVEDLISCNIYIITVPTPIDQFKAPNLAPLLKASEMIGKVLKQDDLVIFESTVYPGCTEEDCVPLLERASGLKFNKDFYCGYSPERINPGDRINTLAKIMKVTSGSTPTIAEVVDSLYKSIILAGTHMAPSIKVAEASKAIENAQRDLNISFVNELALIFDKMQIDTNDVLDAAGTKWNFLKYKPGLVGGHCIGVDPYYLAHKAESLGYYPQVMLSGRRVNDNIGIFISNKIIKLLIGKGQKILGGDVLILGFTFKENCPDIRNTRVIDIYYELRQFGLMVDIYDPHANEKEVETQYGISLTSQLEKKYDAVIHAVNHIEFMKINYSNLKKNKNSIIYDVKSTLNRNLVDARL